MLNNAPQMEYFLINYTQLGYATLKTKFVTTLSETTPSSRRLIQSQGKRHDKRLPEAVLVTSLQT